jgi:hypothetical protein
MATAVGVMTVVISAIYSTVVALGHIPSLLGVFLWYVLTLTLQLLV